jgi:hypothetical protein
MATLPTQDRRAITLDVSGLPEPIIESIRQLVDSVRSRLGATGTAAAMIERQSLRGCLAGQGLRIPTLQEVDDLRREMWSSFPRELPVQEER